MPELENIQNAERAPKGLLRRLGKKAVDRLIPNPQRRAKKLLVRNKARGLPLHSGFYEHVRLGAPLGPLDNRSLEEQNKRPD